MERKGEGEQVAFEWDVSVKETSLPIFFAFIDQKIAKISNSCCSSELQELKKRIQEERESDSNVRCKGNGSANKYKSESISSMKKLNGAVMELVLCSMSKWSGDGAATLSLQIGTLRLLVIGFAADQSQTYRRSHF